MIIKTNNILQIIDKKMQIKLFTCKSIIQKRLVRHTEAPSALL